MKPAIAKPLFVGVVVVAAVSYLAVAGLKGGGAQYHLKVDEFLANRQLQSERVRLAGTVGDDGVVTGAARLGAKFTINGQTRQIPVSYSGVVPDLFKPGCEVVLEGRLDAAGTFQADVMMTKCASKYDAADGAGHQHGAGGADKETRRHGDKEQRS